MDLDLFQKRMNEIFGDFDRESGPFFLATVLMSEIGELADAIKKDEKSAIEEELSDIIFSTVAIANLYQIRISEKLKEKYIDRNVREIIEGWNEPYIKDRLKRLRNSL
ncbi:MAG: MazG nucleotide pyrophosphohydrolase domain-containing protein [Candidatus Hydrothermarchaeota archaeon]